MKRKNLSSDKKSLESVSNIVYQFLLNNINEGYFNHHKYNSYKDLTLNEGSQNNEFDSMILKAMQANKDSERAFSDFKQACKIPRMLDRILSKNQLLLQYCFEFITNNNMITTQKRSEEKKEHSNLLYHSTLFANFPIREKLRFDGKKVLCIINKYNTKRYITVIAGIPFYKSSGKNSKEENTWFLFCGFQETQFVTDNKMTIKNGFIIKPNIDKLYKITVYYPNELCLYYSNNNAEENLANVFQRQGNFNSLSFSMLIGGGFWNKKIGNNLEKFISITFNDQINELYKANKSIIEYIKQCDYDDKDNIKIKTTGDYKELNTWLDHQGSEAIESDPWTRIVNFEYNGFKINNTINIKNKKFK